MFTEADIYISGLHVGSLVADVCEEVQMIFLVSVLVCLDASSCALITSRLLEDPGARGRHQLAQGCSSWRARLHSGLMGKNNTHKPLVFNT